MNKAYATISIIIAVAIIAIAAFFIFRARPATAPGSEEVTEIIEETTETSESTEATEPETSEPALDLYLSAELSDVTTGEVRGIQIGADTTGTAQAGFIENQYVLVATFENLPDPQGDDFYEGWIVRGGGESVLSTGKLVKENGIWTNRFTDTNDLTDHTKYVLTIEPNDGNPASADHLMEGFLE